MDTFSQLLFSTGLIGLSLKNVGKWLERKDIGKLQYALRHGIYDVREKAAEGLGKLKSESSLPVLVEALDDNVKIVSFAVMKVIHEIGVPHGVELKIKDKKKYWAEKELKEIEAIQKFNENMALPSTRKRERPSSKTLENVKQMLKKPMIGGKWF